MDFEKICYISAMMSQYEATLTSNCSQITQGTIILQLKTGLRR